MKVCSGCGKTKPLTDFARDKRRSDGRTSRCKPCTNAYARQYYNAKLDESRAKKRDYVDRNREELNAKARAWARRWRSANPERVRSRAAIDRQRLRETNPDYHREWYYRNIEKERERSRKSMRKARLANPDRERAVKLRYRARNAEAVAKREREKTYARRAKQPYSKELAELMASLVQQPCAYCSATENITIDHITPLSRGGRHEASNLAPACFSCNSSKCDRLLSEWKGRSR